MFGAIDRIRKLATNYSKPELASLVRTGQIPPGDAVLAGMMIDRIAKSAMQPPQTTVAEDVLGAQQGGTGTMAGASMGTGGQQLGPTAPPQMPPPAMAAHGGIMHSLPHSEGVAALHSGLHDMAGGGIVAFADGGDVPGYAGGTLTDSRNDPAMRIDPKEQKRRDMEWRLPILLQELKEAQSEGRDADVASIQREIRSFKPAPTADSGLTALIPSAQAAEKPAPKTRAPAAKAATPMPDYYQDPLGAPDYTTEGFNLKQPIEKGKPYEPTIQGQIFGYEAVEPSKKLPPITPPSKNTAPNPLNVPRAEQATSAPQEEKAPMGPPRPSIMDQMGNYAGESIEVPQEKNLKSIVAEQAEADKAYGANPQKMFDDIRAEYKNTQGDIKDRKDKAAAMALAMWGLGFMGARKGQEFEVFSKSGQQALNNYSSSMDKINDNEDKLKQRMQDLAVAENQYKVSRSDKALSELQSNKREIRAIELENAKLKSHAMIESKKLAVDIFKNENPALFQTLNNIAAEQRAKGKKDYTALDALKDYQGAGRSGEVSRSVAFKEYNDLVANPMTRKEMNEKYPAGFEDYWRALQGGGPAPKGKVKFLGYEGQ